MTGKLLKLLSAALRALPLSHLEHGDRVPPPVLEEQRVGIRVVQVPAYKSSGTVSPQGQVQHFLSPVVSARRQVAQCLGIRGRVVE